MFTIVVVVVVSRHVPKICEYIRNIML